MNVGIYGATGYGGMQLVSLLQGHPNVTIKFLGSNRYTGKKFSELYPKFTGIIDTILLEKNETYSLINEVDLVFLALPHGISMRYVKKLKSLKPTLKIIDFSGDFRINDPEIYEQWYGFDHLLKKEISSFIYGLPEINRELIKKSNYIANPGCFPTSMILPLYPLLKENLIEEKIIVDSKTGVSGAGRKNSQNFLFTEIQDSTFGYKTGTHRHSPEVSQILKESTGKDINLLFSPHVVPSTRGILSTIYVTLKDSSKLNLVKEAYEKYYSDEYFVQVVDFSPSTKDVNKSNRNFIHYTYDNLSDTLIIFSAIDNLMKGASSQAIQNMNIMFGWDEKLGIEFDLHYL